MGRRFEFTLEVVLEHRRRVEEERLRAVATIEAERVRLEDRIRAINARLVLSRADLRQRLMPGSAGGREGGGGSGGIGAVRLDSMSALSMTVEAQQVAIELAGVMRRLGHARASLLEAVTARKGVARLRERRFEEWSTENSRREGAELDELATMGAMRSAATERSTL